MMNQRGRGHLEDRKNSKLRPPRKPLRKVSEMAEEFGVNVMQLAALMRHRVDAPDAVTITVSGKPHRFVEPVAMRKWWKAIHTDDGTLKKFGQS